MLISTLISSLTINLVKKTNVRFVLNNESLLKQLVFHLIYFVVFLFLLIYFSKEQILGGVELKKGYDETSDDENAVSFLRRDAFWSCEMINFTRIQVISKSSSISFTRGPRQQQSRRLQ